ncbi:hypothetical protein HLB00_02730, partial [Ferroplasma acidiphilum]|nr:hypothetical protein [Ferroplasma acidiphilum]
LHLAHNFATIVLVHPVTVSAHSTTSIVTDLALANNIHLSTKTFNISATVDVVS